MFIRRLSVHGVARRAVATAALMALGISARADDAAPVARSVVAGDSVLTGASGIIGVNESAGIANQQANAVAIGVATVPDGVLAGAISQRRSSVPLGSANDRDRTVIAPGAFSSTRGIVQLDQTAGDGNAAINSFALRVRP